MGDFKTIFEAGCAEMSVEKSRFIAYCQPIKSEEEALQFIEIIKKRHWDAAHNVPVYVLGEQYTVQRYSDDGEPSGTAGVPILSMIKNEGLTNLVIVVTRYFGGVKLGTGGLVRAYTHAAKLGLESGRIIDQVTMKALKLVLPYNLHGKVQNYFLTDPTLIVNETEFTEAVSMEIFVNPGQLAAVTAKLGDLSNGQIDITVMDDVRLSIGDGIVLAQSVIES